MVPPRKTVTHTKETFNERSFVMMYSSIWYRLETRLALLQ